MENAVVRNMWRSDELLSPEERVPVAAALRAMTLTQRGNAIPTTKSAVLR